MGSDSDLPTMKAAAEVLEQFGVRVEVTIVSAHRTPERLMEYARSAHQRGLKAIIAGAGEQQSGGWLLLGWAVMKTARNQKAVLGGCRVCCVCCVPAESTPLSLMPICWKINNLGPPPVRADCNQGVRGCGQCNAATQLS
jgi:hypothetical protein